MEEFWSKKAKEKFLHRKLYSGMECSITGNGCKYEK